MEKQKKNRRSRVGKVIKNSGQKTVKVEIEGLVQHPFYKKYIKRHKAFLVHDPEEQCKTGDIVKIEECRPISKRKNWVVRSIVKQADSIDV